MNTHQSGFDALRGFGRRLTGANGPIFGSVASLLRPVAPTETMTERSGILAGGNWIVDRTKMIDCYPAQDALANIMQEASSTGGAPYNMLIDVARLGPAALNPSRLFLTAPALLMM
jgi:hypothetical protein